MSNTQLYFKNIKEHIWCPYYILEKILIPLFYFSIVRLCLEFVQRIFTINKNFSDGYGENGWRTGRALNQFPFSQQARLPRPNAANHGSRNNNNQRRETAIEGLNFLNQKQKIELFLFS